MVKHVVKHYRLRLVSSQMPHIPPKKQKNKAEHDRFRLYLVWVTGLEPAASTTPTDKILFSRCHIVFPVLSCPENPRVPCSRVLLCPNSPSLSMVLVCGQNFCCGQYVVVMWSATPSDFCSHCESGGVCIVALAAAVVKRFRRWKSALHSQRKGKAK